ncbi:MAG: hypothetical protein WC414_00310 [Patescibacteria group bacterium]
MTDLRISAIIFADEDFRFFLKEKYLNDTFHMPTSYTMKNGITFYFYVDKEDGWVHYQLSEKTTENKKLASLDFFIKKLEREKLLLEKEKQQNEGEESEINFNFEIDEDSK